MWWRSTPPPRISVEAGNPRRRTGGLGRIRKRISSHGIIPPCAVQANKRTSSTACCRQEQFPCHTLSLAHGSRGMAPRYRAKRGRIMSFDPVSATFGHEGCDERPQMPSAEFGTVWPFKGRLRWPTPRARPRRIDHYGSMNVHNERRFRNASMAPRTLINSFIPQAASCSAST